MTFIINVYLPACLYECERALMLQLFVRLFDTFDTQAAL